MKKNLLLYILFFVSTQMFAQPKGNAVNLTDFYKAFSSTNLTLIQNQIDILLKQPKYESKAYAGALLMKKADLVSNVADKLSSFTEGKKLLEDCIVKWPNNAEFRFLRLAIQEKCPGFLNYNSAIQIDKKIVLENYKKLAPEIRNAIILYSKSSKIILASEIK